MLTQCDIIRRRVHDLGLLEEGAQREGEGEERA